MKPKTFKESKSARLRNLLTPVLGYFKTKELAITENNHKLHDIAEEMYNQTLKNIDEIFKLAHDDETFNIK